MIYCILAVIFSTVGLGTYIGLEHLLIWSDYERSRISVLMVTSFYNVMSFICYGACMWGVCVYANQTEKVITAVVVSVVCLLGVGFTYYLSIKRYRNELDYESKPDIAGFIVVCIHSLAYIIVSVLTLEFSF